MLKDGKENREKNKKQKTLKCLLRCQNENVTLIFAHEGCLDVFRYPLPHTDGFGILLINTSGSFIKAIVPERMTAKGKAMQSKKNKQKAYLEVQFDT